MTSYSLDQFLRFCDTNPCTRAPDLEFPPVPVCPAGRNSVGAAAAGGPNNSEDDPSALLDVDCPDIPKLAKYVAPGIPIPGSAAIFGHSVTSNANRDGGGGGGGARGQNQQQFQPTATVVMMPSNNSGVDFSNQQQQQMAMMHPGVRAAAAPLPPPPAPMAQTRITRFNAAAAASAGSSAAATPASFGHQLSLNQNQAFPAQPPFGVGTPVTGGSNQLQQQQQQQQHPFPLSGSSAAGKSVSRGANDGNPVSGSSNNSNAGALVLIEWTSADEAKLLEVQQELRDANQSVAKFRQQREDLEQVDEDEREFTLDMLQAVIDQETRASREQQRCNEIMRSLLDKKRAARGKNALGSGNSSGNNPPSGGLSAPLGTAGGNNGMMMMSMMAGSNNTFNNGSNGSKGPTRFADLSRQQQQQNQNQDPFAMMSGGGGGGGGFTSASGMFNGNNNYSNNNNGGGSNNMFGSSSSFAGGGGGGGRFDDDPFSSSGGGGGGGERRYNNSNPNGFSWEKHYSDANLSSSGDMASFDGGQMAQMQMQPSGVGADNGGGFHVQIAKLDDPTQRSSGYAENPLSKLASLEEARWHDTSFRFWERRFPWYDRIKHQLKQRFGLNEFRVRQAEIINAALVGRDQFVLLPTGGGKSLCYQLPAIVPAREGDPQQVTIVFSPLLSLIHDQVSQAEAIHISAIGLVGELSAAERNALFHEWDIGEIRTSLVYITPEYYGRSDALIQRLQRLANSGLLARFVIDEAHCISSWGHDFRPDYKKLQMLRTLFPSVPIMALTATATDLVLNDCLTVLQMNRPPAGLLNARGGIPRPLIFKGSFNRRNLQYFVHKTTAKSVTAKVIEIFRRDINANRSGIVYCLSKRDCEEMASSLRQAGISSGFYHSEQTNKAGVQNDWQHGRIKVMCATIAFGMGINKPDVRCVVHAAMPKSVEGYYQESGRAGRDGNPAQCHLLFCATDIGRLQRLLYGSNDMATQLRNLYTIQRYCTNDTVCRRRQQLGFFSEEFSHCDADVAQAKDIGQSAGGTGNVAHNLRCDNCVLRFGNRAEGGSEVWRPELTDFSERAAQILDCAVHFGSLTQRQLCVVYRGLKSTDKNVAAVIKSRGTHASQGKGRDVSEEFVDKLIVEMLHIGVLSERIAEVGRQNIVGYVSPGRADRVQPLRNGTLKVQMFVRKPVAAIAAAAAAAVGDAAPKQSKARAAAQRWAEQPNEGDSVSGSSDGDHDDGGAGEDDAASAVSSSSSSSSGSDDDAGADDAAASARKKKASTRTKKNSEDDDGSAKKKERPKAKPAAKAQRAPRGKKALAAAAAAAMGNDLVEDIFKDAHYLQEALERTESPAQTLATPRTLQSQIRESMDALVSQLVGEFDTMRQAHGSALPAKITNTVAEWLRVPQMAHASLKDVFRVEGCTPERLLLFGKEILEQYRAFRSRKLGDVRLSAEVLVAEQRFLDDHAKNLAAPPPSVPKPAMKLQFKAAGKRAAPAAALDVDSGDDADGGSRAAREAIDLVTQADGGKKDAFAFMMVNSAAAASSSSTAAAAKKKKAADAIPAASAAAMTTTTTTTAPAPAPKPKRTLFKNVAASVAAAPVATTSTSFTHDSLQPPQQQQQQQQQQQENDDFDNLMNMGKVTLEQEATQHSQRQRGILPALPPPPYFNSVSSSSSGDTSARSTAMFTARTFNSGNSGGRSTTEQNNNSSSNNRVLAQATMMEDEDGDGADQHVDVDDDDDDVEIEERPARRYRDN